ncbi:MAG: hypothetical protein U1F67_23385 [Rubrivivax sp.]
MRSKCPSHAASSAPRKIIIRRHGLESDLGDTALSLGMLLSFLTVPAWSLLLP